MPETDPDPATLAARYRGCLEAEIAELEALSGASSEARRPVELDQQSVGRLSRIDAIQGQAMAQAQEARRAGRGRALRAALSRMDAGEFGFCDECGAFIGHARLALDPASMCCVDCAR